MKFICIVVLSILSLANAVPIGKISSDPNDVHFYLYPNPLNVNDADELTYGDIQSIKVSRYDPKKRLIVYSSGFYQNRTTDQAIKNAYLRADFTSSCNIIVVDWGLLSGNGIKRSSGFLGDLELLQIYIKAVDNVDVVGKRLGEFLTFLIETNQLLGGSENIHLVGQSLGAHVSGKAGYYYQQTTGNLIARITGTDAALQLFQGTNRQKRLDDTDAQFVVTIHTNDGGFGYYGDYGTVDFYVNGGTAPQPGCNGSQTFCSHEMAVRFFAKSIVNNTLIAKKCRSCPYDSNPSTVIFGEYTPSSAKGSFYIDTDPDY